jgi:MFS family permease
VNLALAVMNSFNPVGGFVGPLSGGIIVDHWGFRALLVVDMLMVLLVVLGLSLGYRDTFKGQLSGSLFGMAGGSLAILVRSSRLRVLFPALFLLFIGWMLAGTYVPLAVSSLYQGRNPGTIVGLIFGAGGLLTLVVGPILGALGDRFGLWRVLLLSALGTVVLWPVPALAHDLAFFSITWWLLDGLMSGVFAISFGVLSASVDEARRGRVMSFAFLPFNLAAVVGPALGAVVTPLGVLTVFPVAAGLTAISVLALEVARRQPTQPLSPSPEAVSSALGPQR